MGLQELSGSDRIFFLRDFTLSLLMNSVDDDLVKQSIESEKIKLKYIEPLLEGDVGQSVVFLNEPLQNEQILNSADNIEESNSHLIQLHDKTSSHFLLSSQKSGKNNHKNFIDGVSTIENMINDPLIQMIECPGQGKNVLIKIGEKVIVTKTILIEKDIREIIHSFSIMSKIPIIGGILRAVVDLVYISGIISSYAGSRFIITKKYH